MHHHSMNILPLYRQAARCGFMAALFLALDGMALRLEAAPSSLIKPERVAELAGWMDEHPAGFGWPIAQRANWEKWAQDPEAKRTLAEAQKVAAAPWPEQSDDLFLDFSRTGNRERWQKVASERRGRIARLVLGECLENQGRFLAPLEKVVTELCREKTWVYPAHDRTLANFRGEAREMDLGAVFVAMELAEADYLLGDRLSKETRQLLREQVRARVLHPFREMAEGKRKEIGWMRTLNNWNAVCLGSLTMAALALEESRADRAFYAAAAERYVRFFLSGFTPDGYCSEGISYWNYGFGHFILLTESLRRATHGRLDLLADPTASAPALFAVRSEIVGGLFPSIADCQPGSKPDGRFVAYLCRRFHLGLAACEGPALQGSAGGLAMTMMTRSYEDPLPLARQLEGEITTAGRTWFKEGGVLICRPLDGKARPFAAVLKGGHNAEQHNHNDVGSFSLVVGDRMVICDPGGEVYTARTFSAKRYESKVLNSFGHAVPVVDGQLQQTGAKARGVVLETAFSDAEDVLRLDLRSAYAVDGLQKMERTFRYRRGEQASLVVADDVEFRTSGQFEAALVTWGEWRKLDERTFRIADGDRAVLVEVSTGGLPYEMKETVIEEDVRTARPPRRIGLSLLQPVSKATVTLSIRPE